MERMTGCPGSDMRDVTVGEVVCPACGEHVELFSDERGRRCPKCHARVDRDAAPSCAAWCASAAACLGADRYKEFLESTGVPPEHPGEE